MTKRGKIPAMSSKKLVKLLEEAGASFDRRGKGDRATDYSNKMLMLIESTTIFSAMMPE